MACNCNYGSYDKMFDERNAKRDLRRYNKKGLRKETKILFDALKDKVAGLSVTELGSGIGVLAINLTKAGARKYMGSEISKPSIEMAEDLVKKEQLKKKINFTKEDLIEKKNYFKEVDLVLSDKVVCCYPNMEKFVNVTASKAKKYYAIVYPQETKIGKIIIKVINFVLQLTKRKGFHVYIHSTERINEIIRSYGFKRIFYDKTFSWEILVFEKMKKS